MFYVTTPNTMVKHKFGLVGPVFGKTQRTYGLVAKLLSYGISAGGVFSPSHNYIGSVSEVRHNKRIADQVSAESSETEVEVLICDSTVVDHYAHYAFTHPHSALREHVFGYVKGWASTYTSLIYVPEQRFLISDTLSDLLTNVSEFGSKLNVVEGSKVMDIVLRGMNRQRPLLRTHLNGQQCQWLANQLQKPVVTKFEVDPIVGQELFVVSESNDFNSYDLWHTCRNVFGSTAFDMKVSPSLVRFLSDKRYYIFHPQSHGN